MPNVVVALPPRIIADYLIAAGETVFHILGAVHIERTHIMEVGVLWRIDLSSQSLTLV
jgi:hypothetical protein